MINENEKIYPYKSIPLTPSIIEELIEELFDGKLIVRQTIVDEVVKYHEKNGGAKSNAQDVPRSVKKALSNMKEKGLADNPSFGYWRIGELSFIESDNTEVANENVLTETINPIADKVIGIGTGAVYLYYLPMYKQKAELENETMWHCKIGRTERDPLLRVLSQASTALPEKPHISLIFKTNFPAALEMAIHSILTIRGRKIDSSPGSEWFLTSPDEVEKIVEIILQ